MDVKVLYATAFGTGVSHYWKCSLFCF